MLDYARAFVHNYVRGCLLQKWEARTTPPLRQIGGGGDVAGLTAVVTGPTSGIGWATATELARRGAHVVLACRSQAKGDAMVERLRRDAAQEGRAPPSLEVSLLDLASLASVRAFVERWERARRPLHVLVCNAGLFNMGVPRSETADGLEVHMQTNHLAHFLLTLGLLPALERGAAERRQQQQDKQQDKQQQQQQPFRSRVVNVASAMHYFGTALSAADPLLSAGGGRAYSAERAYGNSKLAQVALTAELNRRLRTRAAGAGGNDGSGKDGGKDGKDGDGVLVDALALHPGNVMTDVVRSLPPLVQAGYRAVMRGLLFTPEEGARASVYAAADPGAPAAAAPFGWYLDANARPARPAARARDGALAAWLWAWSAAQVQLPEAWDLPPATK